MHFLAGVTGAAVHDYHWSNECWKLEDVDSRLKNAAVGRNSAEVYLSWLLGVEVVESLSR